MKRAIVIGASSGLGMEVSKLLLADGWSLGVAARRTDALQEIKEINPANVETASIDITDADASQHLMELIDRIGGLDLFFLASGIGKQNTALAIDIEMKTVETNVLGFTRMVDTAFHYFVRHHGGHIAVISSIAGTKGLGVAPAYSATKRFQNTYIDALAQLSRMQRLNIRFTDIRPGFVATDLLRNGKYPMLMRADKVALCIVRSLERKKRTVIIDRRYRLLVFFWRMIPRWLWERLPIKN